MNPPPLYDLACQIIVGFGPEYAKDSALRSYLSTLRITEELIIERLTEIENGEQEQDDPFDIHGHPV